MESDIPDGRIVDRTRTVRLVDDPAVAFAGRAQALAFNFMTAGLAVEEAPDVDILVAVDGVGRKCPVRLVDVGLPAFVIDMWCETDHIAYLVVRRRGDGSWGISTRALVLPADNPESWGAPDAARCQRTSRILRFAGMAIEHGWFEPVERS